MRDQLKATLTGQKVLAGLAKGRQRAIAQAKERSAKNMLEVVRLANEDQAAGRAYRGLAGRISRKLKGTLSERSVRRNLVMLFSLSDSKVQNEPSLKQGGLR